jgi:DNA ligase-1
MLKPWEVIAELNTDNSRLFKEAIVKREAEAGNTEFFRGARAALDSMITFGVRQVEPKTGNGRGLKSDTFWKTLEQLANRSLTGNAAQTAVNHLRMNATEDEWNLWYRLILIKDLRCGVSEKTINKMVEKDYVNYSIPVFSCQLAHDSANHESKVGGQKLIEVKLDGVRVITVVYPNGTVDQYSRNGKELVNFPHIKAQIAKHAVFFGEPVVLDGEVMSGSFQDLMKQVHRKSDVTATDAVLNLFDVVTLKEFTTGTSTMPQITRSNGLKAWWYPLKEHMPNVTVVGQELVDLDTIKGQERFKMINTQAVAGGYEGIMIKDPDAGYECKRSHAWLKMKPFIEVTLTVVGLEEGTGKNAGKLGALICEGIDDGKSIRVNVGSGLTDDLRDTIWKDKTAVVGQLVEIRADAATRSQDSEDTYSLRFPRFKGFRGFEAGEKI